MQAFAARSLSLSLCVHVCVLGSVSQFIVTHPHTHIPLHTLATPVFQCEAQAKYRHIPMMKLHVAKCATAAHARQTHTLPSPFPATLSLARSLSLSVSPACVFIHLSHLWLPFLGLLQND